MRRTIFTPAAVMVLLLVALIAVPSHTLGSSVPDMEMETETDLNLPSYRRILVFAPHPDDETLALGGLLSAAIRNGSDVTVVFMTCGDGYSLAAARRFNTLQPSNRQCIDFGRIRQLEAVRALGALGAPRDNVVFLGYPDRGLAPMWQTNWDFNALYTSPQTGRSSSPYADTYRPRTKHCGASAADDVLSIISDTQPDLIFAPHPRDTHSDHWATYAFVSWALGQLREWDPSVGRGDAARGPRLLTYLVHYGAAWPSPSGYDPKAAMELPTAPALNGQTWITFELDDISRVAKASALKAYRTQLAMMPFFLRNFLRTNEVFSLAPEDDALPVGGPDAVRRKVVRPQVVPSPAPWSFPRVTDPLPAQPGQ